MGKMDRRVSIAPSWGDPLCGRNSGRVVECTLVPPMINQAFPACICRNHTPSFLDRPEIFLPVILVMFVSFGVLLAMADFPFGIQLGSLIPYTACVFLGTFSAQRGQQPYFLECPIV